jgi:hypothetical protein
MFEENAIGASCCKRRNGSYMEGLQSWGLSVSEIDRISQSLGRGELPPEVLDVIFNGRDRLEGIHPDNYPTRRLPDACEDVVWGLGQARIDVEAV